MALLLVARLSRVGLAWVSSPHGGHRAVVVRRYAPVALACGCRLRWADVFGGAGEHLSRVRTSYPWI
jgi:hypothetical protein